MNANVVRWMVGSTLVFMGTTSASAQAKMEVDEWWESEHAPAWDVRRPTDPVRADGRRGYRDERGRIDVRSDLPRAWDHRPRARRRSSYRTRWVEARWRDVRFRERALYGLGEGRFGPAALRRVVGKKVYRRLERYAVAIGAYGPLTARVVPTRGPIIVQVRAGRVPVAELIDFDYDRRVDRILLSQPTGRYR